MAYQLKTTGIAANCTMCLAVDPDTSTVKDFASAAVTADMQVGANVAIGSQAWDGNTRRYFRPGSGVTAADFVLFGTNKPQFVFNADGISKTIAWIGEAAGGQVRVFGNDSSNYFCTQNTGTGGSTYPFFGAGASNINGGNAAPVSGNKAIFGFSLTFNVSATAYVAMDSAASMTTTALSAASLFSNYAISAVNRRNDSTTHQQDKTHAILIFNTALTEAQWDSLRDDWFGVLFETAGGGAIDATAPGATLTGTATLTPGAASGNTSGSFASDEMVNNTGSTLADTAVVWTWWQGSIGATPDSLTHGTGTTDSSGVLAVTGLPTGAGFLIVRTTDASGVYYQPGTVA